MPKARLIRGIAARIFMPDETVKLVLTALADELADALVAEGVASIHGIGRLRGAFASIPVHIPRALRLPAN